MRRLLLALAIWQALDLLTTYVLMTQHGGIEANALSAALLSSGWESLALAKVALVAISTAAAYVLARTNPRLAMRGLIVTVAAYTLVVGWNTALLLTVA